MRIGEGFDADFLQDDDLGVRRAAERGGPECSAQSSLYVVQIGLSLLSLVYSQLSASVDASWTSSHCVWREGRFASKTESQKSSGNTGTAISNRRISRASLPLGGGGGWVAYITG